MGAFATALLAAGYEVLVLDMPAHGESGGVTASILDASQALLALQSVTGPWHAAIAHSVGTAALVHALGAGLQVDSVVLLAPPARYADYASGFARQAGLDSAGTEQMILLLAEQGVNVHEVNTPRTAAVLTHPALVVHSDDDRVVPINDGEEIAAAWTGAQFLRLSGLGHRRILHSTDVIAAVLAFIPRS
jgi:pimeloyl-ACP methyl ester carboxylesterase